MTTILAHLGVTMKTIGVHTDTLKKQTITKNTTQMNKIRFHLGRGKNYMKWQIKTDKGVSYVSPEESQIVMFNAKLVNQLGTAKKIYDGANKTVCAWIECEDFAVTERVTYAGNDFMPLFFNPRKNYNWVDLYGNIVNKSQFSLVLTKERNIFAR